MDNQQPYTPPSRVQALARFALKYARRKVTTPPAAHAPNNADRVAPPTYKPNGLVLGLKICGALLAVLLGLWLLACVGDPMPARACVRSKLWSALAVAAHYGALFLGIWAGIEVTKRWRRSWLGWLIGIGVTIGFSLFLAWIGIVYPETSSDY